MSLRARLSAAFAAVVLGPVLLGALAVAGAVDMMARGLTAERLDRGSVAVQAAVNAQCQRLMASAEAVVLSSDRVVGDVPPTGVVNDPAAFEAGLAARAQGVVDRGLARAVRVVRLTGEVVATAGGAPPPPWAECGGSSLASEIPVGWRYEALAARAELRDADGELLGYAYAAIVVDEGFLRWLGDSSGVTVSVPGAANDLAEGQTGRASDGSSVRRLAPRVGQPLPLAVSVSRLWPDPLRPVLLVALAAIVAALAIAWWLARTAIQPLVALTAAADRIAEGDLSARVPVTGHDEVGRLGITVNRMVREMRGYVQALTASRDQLRDNLGLLGDTLSSTHDLGRILQVILQTSVGATSARAGVILLGGVAGEEGPGLLVGQCAVGLGGRGPGGGPLELHKLRIRVGEGLLGTVAASGQPGRGRLDPSAELAEGEPRCTTYVAVPFAVPGRLMGVLALFDRIGGDGFDETDLETLETFAGQAAVAVENVLLHNEARRMSITDPLTGLGNYRYLRDRLRTEVERAARFGRALGVLALDLDRFKNVNDVYGHRAGDAVLAEFALRLRGVVREVDLAFRRGGEEFVVLLPETDANGCVTAARRIGAAIRDEAFTVDHRLVGGPPEIHISVSIGIAVFPQHAVTGSDVLDAADEALYAAKAAGRDTFVLARVAPVVSGRGG